jgi:hypothetical protein
MQKPTIEYSKQSKKLQKTHIRTEIFAKSIENRQKTPKN